MATWFQVCTWWACWVLRTAALSTACVMGGCSSCMCKHVITCVYYKCFLHVFTWILSWRCVQWDREKVSIQFNVHDSFLLLLFYVVQLCHAAPSPWTKITSSRTACTSTLTILFLCDQGQTQRANHSDGGGLVCFFECSVRGSCICSNGISSLTAEGLVMNFTSGKILLRRFRISNISGNYLYLYICACIITHIPLYNINICSIIMNYHQVIFTYFHTSICQSTPQLLEY